MGGCRHTFVLLCAEGQGHLCVSRTFLHGLLLTGAGKMRIALCNYTIELLELPEG